VSSERRREGKTAVPWKDGGQDTLPSFGGLPGAGTAFAVTVARGEVGIFVGSSKSLIAA
jgi:hypothetical protein